MAQDLSSIGISYKEESVSGTPESGSGASALEVLSSPGFSYQGSPINTELLSRLRMAGRDRQGSEFFNWAATTELQVGNVKPIMQAVVGGTWSAATTLDETTLTSVTITGSGTIITFAAGNTITAGARVLASAKFAGLGVAGNNGKSFPILSISTNGRVWTIPSGILADQATDSSFSVVLADRVFTNPAGYTPRSFTIAHDLAGLTAPRTLRGAGFRFNEFSLNIGQNKMVNLGLGAGGTQLELMDAGDYPNFPSPTDNSGESLVLLDGAIYFNGVRRASLSSFSFGLKAPISGLQQATTKVSPDAYLGQFKLDGNFTGVIEDGDDFDSWRAEDRVSVYLHCAEQSASDPFGARYVGIGLPNMGFGGWSMPAGGEGPAIQTIPMNGGRDKRGATLGFAATSVIFSTSN